MGKICTCTAVHARLVRQILCGASAPKSSWHSGRWPPRRPLSVRWGLSACASSTWRVPSAVTLTPSHMGVKDLTCIRKFAVHVSSEYLEWVFFQAMNRAVANFEPLRLRSLSFCLHVNQQFFRLRARVDKVFCLTIGDTLAQ